MSITALYFPQKQTKQRNLSSTLDAVSWKKTSLPTWALPGRDQGCSSSNLIFFCLSSSAIENLQRADSPESELHPKQVPENRDSFPVRLDPQRGGRAGNPGIQLQPHLPNPQAGWQWLHRSFQNKLPSYPQDELVHPGTDSKQGGSKGTFKRDRPMAQAVLCPRSGLLITLRRDFQISASHTEQLTAFKHLHLLSFIHKLFLKLIYFLFRTPPPQLIFEYSFLLLVSGTFLPLWKKTPKKPWRQLLFAV